MKRNEAHPQPAHPLPALPPRWGGIQFHPPGSCRCGPPGPRPPGTVPSQRPARRRTSGAPRSTLLKLPAQRGQHVRLVRKVGDEIQAVGVDHQHRRGPPAADPPAVEAVETAQVGRVEPALHGSSAQRDAPALGAHRRLEVDQQRRRRQHVADRAVERDVGLVLAGREEAALGEVGGEDLRVLVDRPVEHRRAVEVPDLPVGLELAREKPDLRREREAGHVAVEIPEEGVVLVALVEGVHAEALLQEADQARLAGADAPGDGDEPGLHGGCPPRLGRECRGAGAIGQIPPRREGLPFFREIVYKKRSFESGGYTR